MLYEKYEQTLDAWAEAERAMAAQATEADDERMHSIHLMKASMMGDMLKALGRAELFGKPGVLEKIAAQFEAESQKMSEKEDFDAAERALIKAQTVRRALACLKGAGE